MHYGHNKKSGHKELFLNYVNYKLKMLMSGQSIEYSINLKIVNTIDIFIIQ